MNTLPTIAAPPARRAPEKFHAPFYRDVIKGLTATPKFLESKYFYDAAGDRLFQEIMRSPEYYPTGCETEILARHSQDIIKAIRSNTGDFDLVELGAGDATKTRYLLEEMLAQGVDFTYFPVDISKNVLRSLGQSLPDQLPSLHWEGLHGEYFEMLQEAGERSGKNKVVLFMGANIGNFTPEDALLFCLSIREQLRPGDLLMIGFDLKKEPNTILNAYNDRKGITRAFNLNLLSRINRELGADFNIGHFEHYPTYDPLTGACKSYLISLRKQRVRIGADVYVDFQENEPVYMEISQKYSLEETNRMASSSGFEPIIHFMDGKRWFADSLWKCR